MDASAVEKVVFDNGRLGSFNAIESEGVETILRMIRAVFPRHDVWAGTLRGPTQCVIFGTYNPGRNKPLFAFYGPRATGGHVTFGLRFDDKKLRATLEGEKYLYGQRFALDSAGEDPEEIQLYLQWIATRAELAKRMDGGELVESDRTAVDDVLLIASSTHLAATVRKQLIDARVGQGKFREGVLARWQGRCAVTECKIPQALRASHIVAWNQSNDVEKLDPENGLPLIATMDALFDRGLISFGDDGTMLIADALNGEYENLGIEAGMKLFRDLTEREKDYMARHRSWARLG